MGRATRARIIESADDLIYRNGFEHTSFAAIAERVWISRGNFYHHFKSKDEILAAVIAARVEATRAMVADWTAAEPTPLGRIGRYVRIVQINGALIEDFGCPVGTLTGELAKLDHPCRDRARAVFEVFRVWLVEQFTELGLAARADELALQVIAFSQGMATVLVAYGDHAFVAREVERELDRLSRLEPDTPP